LRHRIVVMAGETLASTHAVPATAAMAGGSKRMDTYNIYMDEIPTGSEIDGEAGYEVEFRVAANSQDDGDPENNAVLAGLDLVDLINLRDAIQGEIDNFALIALEAVAEAGDDDLEP
jgi:hypothetical protein